MASGMGFGGMRERMRDVRARLRPVVDPAVDVLRGSKRDDVLGLSAELAYRWFLALFPFGIFLGAAGSFIASTLPVPDPTATVMSSLAGLLPPEAARLIEGELRRILEDRDLRVLSFSALAALFVATGGTNAVIKAMNRAYDVPEGRPWWRRYLVALSLTAVAGFAVITAFVIFVPAQVLASTIASTLGLGEHAALAVAIGSWASAFVVLVIAVTVLFRFAPNIRIPLVRIVPGALLFAVGWLLATAVFTFYVATIGSYTATYGALAGVAVLLIWFYVTGLLLLVSAEANQVLHQRLQPADLRGRQEEAQRNGTDAG